MHQLTKWSQERRKKQNISLMLVAFYAVCVSTVVFMRATGNRPVVVGSLSIDGMAAGGFLVWLATAASIIATVVEPYVGGLYSLRATCVTIVVYVFGFLTQQELNILTGIIGALVTTGMVYVIRSGILALEKENHTDYLTGLMNRRAMLEYVDSCIAEQRSFSLMYLNLDGFKIVNDNYGHQAGDRLLLLVAERWREILPPQARLARMGGDEFVVIMPDETRDSTKFFAQELLDSVSDNGFRDVQDDNERYISSSIGIVQYPLDAMDTETLIRYADIAMYYARRNGKNKSFVFDEAMSRRMERELELENMVLDGIKENLFYLMYQPLYTAADGRLIGFEALARLRTTDGQVAEPGEFIPAAEKNNLIMEIDRVIMRRALSEFADIVSRKGSDIVLSVNVSTKHILENDYVAYLERELRAVGFPPDKLYVEITENCFLDSFDRAIDVLRQLKKLGVRLALDDFGSGYASMNYLTLMPIDVLKIDKVLVDDILISTKRVGIIKALVEMGHISEMRVMAEGVETQEQLAILKDAGCDYIQGFLWSRPLNYKDVLPMLGKK